MVGLIYVMFAVSILAIIFAVFMLIKRKNISTNVDKYDVFTVSGNQLTVLAGLPVTYEIDTIEKITFSVQRDRRGSTYVGIMRIIKANGKKSRPFFFDSSVCKKKFVLVNSRQDIEQAIEYLTIELKRYHIRCSDKIQDKT